MNVCKATGGRHPYGGPDAVDVDRCGACGEAMPTLSFYPIRPANESVARLAVPGEGETK